MTSNPTATSASGRKRSCDEMLDAGCPVPSCRPPTPTSATAEPILIPDETLIYLKECVDYVVCAAEPILIPDETLIYLKKCVDYVVGAGRTLQTDSFAEGVRIHPFFAGTTPMMEQRADLESRKLPRLDPQTTEPAGGVDAGVERSPTLDPPIDHATIALGIGWSTIPHAPAMLAAARGWARYIENHYPLSSVEVIWQNKTLPAYLVLAVDQQGFVGYYLFEESLRKGRLVAVTVNRMLANLRASPRQYDGRMLYAKYPAITLSSNHEAHRVEERMETD